MFKESLENFIGTKAKILAELMVSERFHCKAGALCHGGED